MCTNHLREYDLSATWLYNFIYNQKFVLARDYLITLGAIPAVSNVTNARLYTVFTYAVLSDSVVMWTKQ